MRIRRAKLLRHGRRETLDSVAEAIGVSSAQLSRFERFERNLTYEQLKRLSVFFGEPIDTLLEPVIEDAVDGLKAARVGEAGVG